MARFSTRSAAFLGLLALGSGVRVGAQVPAPTGAASVEIVSPHAPVYAAPRAGSSRRGTLALRSRLPFVARVRGDGCSTGVWIDLGERRFVCEEFVAYSPEPPHASEHPTVAPGESLPFRYAFVRYDATPAYGRPNDYFLGDFLETYGQGFGLVVTGQSVVDGIGFLRLRRGTYVTDDAVNFARGSSFEGVSIPAGEGLRLAWTRLPVTRLHVRPNGRVARRAGRREQVNVLRVDGEWAALEGGLFVRAAELNRAVESPRPEGVGPNERWIDVSVAEQVLVAYEGDRPVFATLVSTGSDRPTSATPIGAFRIWAKLATSDMDDLERVDVMENYLIEAVPWVQYFEGGNALHAAFWHDDFGRRRSHGCINLAPRDARYLYGFTQPVVPSGWEAYVPFVDEARTVVRVRP